MEEVAVQGHVTSYNTNSKCKQQTKTSELHQICLPYTHYMYLYIYKLYTEMRSKIVCHFLFKANGVVLSGG